jgi:regulator of PEP synthase PpsR (kinase-PPPase family)
LNSPTIPRTIFAVSDATGTTAETVLRAALVQFRNQQVEIKTINHVKTDERLQVVFRLARRHGALVAFTLVDAALRDAAHRLGKDLGVDTFDLLGGLLVRLSEVLDSEPVGVPGREGVGDAYFRRVEAMEFSVKHDDGADPQHLHRADIVLVGVSRTSKTPLSTYLAQRSWKVANVPIVLGISPPPQLAEIDQDRVFALTIEAEVLQEIRASRMRSLGMDHDVNYGHIQHILDELRAAEDLFRRNTRWPVVDVTHRAIEETAAIIEGMLVQRLRRRERIRDGQAKGAAEIS